MSLTVLDYARRERVRLVAELLRVDGVIASGSAGIWLTTLARNAAGNGPGVGEPASSITGTIQPSAGFTSLNPPASPAMNTFSSC